VCDDSGDGKFKNKKNKKKFPCPRNKRPKVPFMVYPNHNPSNNNSVKKNEKKI
jgi:hypothetical protein